MVEIVEMARRRRIGDAFDGGALPATYEDANRVQWFIEQKASGALRATILKTSSTGYDVEDEFELAAPREDMKAKIDAFAVANRGKLTIRVVESPTRKSSALVIIALLLAAYVLDEKKRKRRGRR